VSTSLDEFIGSDKPKLTVEYVLKVVNEGRRGRMQGKVVGVLANTPHGKLYITWRKPSERFRKYDSWGITEDVLRTVKAHGAEKVVILCEGKDSVERWVSDIYDWFTSSHTYWWKEGHELQRHLPVSMQKMLPHGR